MVTGELYKNPPIALALIEIKHPVAGSLSVPEIALVKEQVASMTPIQRMEEGVEINPMTGEQKHIRFPRFVSRDLHTSISFRVDAVVVETTDYRGWNWFRSVLDIAVRTRQDVAPVDGIERIGLRYVDEVRPPQKYLADLSWPDWVVSELMGPTEKVKIPGLKLEQQQGVVSYSMSTPGDTLTLRFGPNLGQAVASNQNLVRKFNDSGPFFLIDVDAAFTPTNAVPEFSPSEILNTSDRLHEPIGSLFELLVTEKLRKEVLRVAR